MAFRYTQCKAEPPLKQFRWPLLPQPRMSFLLSLLQMIWHIWVKPLSNVTTTAWSINLFQTHVTTKRTKPLRLPDVSALSGFEQRIPLSKNESNTCFWSYVSTLDISLCFGIFLPSSNETEEHAITSMFTAEEKRQPEIRQRGVSMHRRLAISTFFTFCSKLVLVVPCCR